MTEDGIGVPLRRREDRRFLTGRGRYVHDIVLPQQFHAVFLRSPHAHAEIVAIDKAEALASPGVVAIFTAEDVSADKLNGVPCAWGIVGKDDKPMKEPPHPLLAQGKVRHVGDPVAMVIADSVEVARSAAERINVDYRVLRAVAEVTAAMRPGAPQLYEDVPGNLCCDWAIGDAAATDAAFAKAHHIAKIDLVNNRLVPNAMESRAALAEYEPATGGYTLYTSTQLPHVARVLIGVLVLGIPERKLRVVAPDVGGGFGSKQVVYAEEALVTWAARRLERPVKWVADRSEASNPTRKAATMSPVPSWRSTETAGFSGYACRHSPISGAISRPSGPTFRPTSMARYSPASTPPRRSIARSRWYSRTPCRRMPIAAPAVRKPPSCWSG
jgi:carbon-monoxide dehydrogenase large subunit